jgi:hypothetical protein
MGNTCCKKKEDGVCIICMRECTTKSCKCSFMHKQCAELYIKNTGKYCSICGIKFGTFLLQNIPKLTMSEREHLKIQKTKHEDFIQHEKNYKNKKIKMYSLNKWGK